MDIPLAIDGRYALGASVARTDKGTVLHLINWSARVKRPVDEITPMVDVPVTYKAPGKVKSVRALVAGKTLPHKVRKGVVSFTIPRIEGYEIVLIALG